MGVLIANKYPTKLFLKAADHTYVECGQGAKTWSCWGGHTGGTPFNSGTGSTRRADTIAEPNERAGITCYLINGVCHQAANRILIPAQILVIGARGYSLSAAIFGVYGKVGAGRCTAPFNQQTGVTGDIPACAGQSRSATPKLPMLPGENGHIGVIKRAYNRFDAEVATPLDALNLNVHLFELEVKFRLKDSLTNEVAQSLRRAKVNVELEHYLLTTRWGRQEIPAVDFVKAFNAMTLKFQDDVANALNETLYRRLLSLEREERLLLAEPEGIDAYFGKGTAANVYGNQMRQ